MVASQIVFEWLLWAALLGARTFVSFDPIESIECTLFEVSYLYWTIAANGPTERASVPGA